MDGAVSDSVTPTSLTCSPLNHDLERTTLAAGLCSSRHEPIARHWRRRRTIRSFKRLEFEDALTILSPYRVVIPPALCAAHAIKVHSPIRLALTSTHLGLGTKSSTTMYTLHSLTPSQNGHSPTTGRSVCSTTFRSRRPKNFPQRKASPFPKSFSQATMTSAIGHMYSRRQPHRALSS